MYTTVPGCVSLLKNNRLLIPGVNYAVVYLQFLAIETENSVLSCPLFW